MATERLQKILAGAGAASRRAAERMILEGRVRVNGRIVKELGAKADPHRDRVELDGRRVVAEQPVYYLLHKPREMVTTLSDPEGRPTIADLVKRHIPERVFPVGRLDYHTSGALLLTNDGEMAQALLHPRKQVPKTYIAKFKGELSLKQLEALREGVVLDGGEKTGKAELFVINVEHGNTWVQITITEGKNRQIHRMGEAIGHRVMRLSRVAFAQLTTEGLRPGEFRMLTQQELAKLKRDYLNPSQKAKAEAARTRRRMRAAGQVDDGGEREAEGIGFEAGAPSSRGSASAAPRRQRPLRARPQRKPPQRERDARRFDRDAKRKERDRDQEGARSNHEGPRRRDERPPRKGAHRAARDPERGPQRGPRPPRPRGKKPRKTS